MIVKGGIRQKMATSSDRIRDAVRLLLAPPTPEQRSLLEAVSRPFLQTGEWPVMDYVDAVLDDQGLDVWRVRETFSSWPVRYSAVWPGPGSLINAEEKIGLTVAGLGLCAALSEDARAIVEDYLVVLRYLADRFREAPASPTEARHVEVTSDDIGSRLEEVGRVVSLEEKMVRCGQLYSVWQHEFTGWKAGSTFRTPTDWSVIVRREIRTYAQVVDIEGYLTRIAQSVLPSGSRSPPSHPSSLTLPEAIDYLDAVWRVRFAQRLFNLPGAAKTASLSLPCATSDEFDSRLSALSDLLDRMTVRPPDAPLAAGHDQPPPVEAESVEHGRVHVGDVVWRLHRVETEFVRRAVDHTALDPGTVEPDREAVRVIAGASPQ